MTTLSGAQLLALSETDVTVHLAPAQFGPAVTQPPFVSVQGTFNVRDLGRVPSSAADAAGAAATANPLRPGLAFRSGMLNHLTAAGKATLAHDLGVRRIFDLRSQSEHAAGPDPQPADSVTLVWAPSSEASPDVDLAPFAAGAGEAGFAATYLETLDAYRPTITALLEHVRDRPAEPFLFHCTAGRDRTGVVAGLLLSLAGASADVVALDYMLSRLGTEPVRKELEAFARKGAGVPSTSGDGSDGAEDPAKLPPGFLNLLNLRVCCWDAFVAALDQAHGGFAGYVTGVLGFSAADLATIRHNLTTAPA